MDSIKIFEILKSRQYNTTPIQDKEGLLKSIDYFIKLNLPIKLVAYWGITNKPKTDNLDIETMEFLESINKRIQEIYPKGIAFDLILTDHHAFTINNYTKDEVNNYFIGLKDLFNKYNNIKLFILSELRQQIKLSPLIKIDYTPSKDLIPLLNRGALRMHKGCNLEGSIELYYKTRIQEKAIFEGLFSKDIFFTYNNPKYKELFPNLPVLYLFARKGKSAPPWV